MNAASNDFKYSGILADSNALRGVDAATVIKMDDKDIILLIRDHYIKIDITNIDVGHNN